jgi:hypothetical protein
MSAKEPDKLVMENPSYSRTGKAQMRKGGVSEPRNKTLMKMFNLQVKGAIGIGRVMVDDFVVVTVIYLKLIVLSI